MLYIKIIIMVFIVFYSNFTQAKFEHLKIDNNYEFKIKNSIARIDLFSLNGQKKELKHIGYGHGVLISHTGLILTSAHVIFPSRNFDNIALFYRIKISKWNENEKKFEYFDQFDSDMVKDRVIFSNKLSLENWQPNSNFDPMIVQKSELKREKDFALIITNKESDFIDITGPFDELDPNRAVTNEWVKVVVSDFFKKSRIRDYKVYQPDNKKPYVLEIDGKGEFHKGISGSPLLVLTRNGRVFVAGIVKEVEKNPNLTEQEDKLNICNVSLINEVLLDIAYNLRALLGEKKEFYDCKNIYYPYPEPLLINYCIYLKKINKEKDFFERERGIKLSEKDMNVISGCLVENETWDSTRAVLKYANKVAKIATLVGEMLNRKKKGFDITVATAKPDTDIAQVLDKKPLTKKEDELFSELIREVSQYQSETKGKLVKNIPAVIIPKNGSWGLEQVSTIIENDKASLYNQAWIEKSEFVKQALIINK